MSYSHSHSSLARGFPGYGRVESTPMRSWSFPSRVPRYPGPKQSGKLHRNERQRTILIEESDLGLDIYRRAGTRR
jgi:hypothetical protein